MTAALVQYFETLRHNLPGEHIKRILVSEGRQTRANQTGNTKPDEEHEELEEVIAEWLQSMEVLIPPDLYKSLEEMVRMGFTGALSVWSAVLSLDVSTQDALLKRLNEWVKEQQDRQVKSVNQRIQTDIVTIITEGMAAGLPLADILQNIRTYFENGGGRAATYGWLETYRALYWGEYLANKALGASRKRWVTLHDLRSCGQCLSNEAQGLIPIDQPFASGHQHPLAHYRCRCRVEYFGVTPEGMLDALTEL